MSLYIRYSGEKTKTTFLKNISTCCLLQFYIYIYIYIYIFVFIFIYKYIYIYAVVLSYYKYCSDYFV